ncbi:MAG TPA: SGNH/GDSL hydrolase family protein, partial [Microthrixaceae bacterium]|nr:SGNH/GDSL hydrolase family protein [Microthrixaceae bacterium]
MLRVVTVVVATLAVVATGVVVLDRVTTRDGDKVLVLGDSITEWSTPALETGLGGRFHLQVIGRGGFRSEQLQPEAVAAAVTGPTQVILNAGTNDALQHRPWADTAASIEQMVA